MTLTIKKLFLSLVLVFALVLCVGCGDFDLAKAKEKLEEKDFLVLSYEGDKAENYGQSEEGKVVGVLVAQRGLLNGTTVTIIKYDSAKAAKDHAKKLDSEESKYYYAVSKNAIIFSTNEDVLKEVKQLF